MGRINVREAKLYDVPAICRIENESYSHPWSAEQITREVMTNERAYVAVAELDGEVVGFADMWVMPGEAQVYNLAVDPSCRRQGVAELLLEHLIVKSLMMCKVMTLEVRKSNVAALALYTKKGFREVGVRKGYYKDGGEDAVLMDLDLETAPEGQEGGEPLEVDIDVV